MYVWNITVIKGVGGKNSLFQRLLFEKQLLSGMEPTVLDSKPNTHTKTQRVAGLGRLITQNLEKEKVESEWDPNPVGTIDWMTRVKISVIVIYLVSNEMKMV